MYRITIPGGGGGGGGINCLSISLFPAMPAIGGGGGGGGISPPSTRPTIFSLKGETKHKHNWKNK